MTTSDELEDDSSVSCKPAKNPRQQVYPTASAFLTSLPALAKHFVSASVGQGRKRKWGAFTDHGIKIDIHHELRSRMRAAGLISGVAKGIEVRSSGLTKTNIQARHI